jgi:hypothetical protein
LAKRWSPKSVLWVQFLLPATFFNKWWIIDIAIYIYFYSRHLLYKAGLALLKTKYTAFTGFPLVKSLDVEKIEKNIKDKMLLSFFFVVIYFLVPSLTYIYSNLYIQLIFFLLFGFMYSFVIKRFKSYIFLYLKIIGIYKKKTSVSQELAFNSTDDTDAFSKTKELPSTIESIFKEEEMTFQKAFKILRDPAEYAAFKQYLRENRDDMDQEEIEASDFILMNIELLDLFQSAVLHVITVAGIIPPNLLGLVGFIILLGLTTPGLVMLPFVITSIFVNLLTQVGLLHLMFYLGEPTQMGFILIKVIGSVAGVSVSYFLRRYGYSYLNSEQTKEQEQQDQDSESGSDDSDDI